jgi:hypothetical protein
MALAVVEPTLKYHPSKLEVLTSSGISRAGTLYGG